MAALAELRIQVKAKNARLEKGHKFNAFGKSRVAIEQFLGISSAPPAAKAPRATASKATGKKFETSKTSSAIAHAISKKTGGDAKEIHESLKKKLQAAIDKKRKQMEEDGLEPAPKDLRAAVVLAVKQAAREALKGKVASEERSSKTGRAKSEDFHTREALENEFFSIYQRLKDGGHSNRAGVPIDAIKKELKDKIDSFEFDALVKTLRTEKAVHLNEDPASLDLGRLDLTIRRSQQGKGLGEDDARQARIDRNNAAIKSGKAAKLGGAKPEVKPERFTDLISKGAAETGKYKDLEDSIKNATAVSQARKDIADRWKSAASSTPAEKKVKSRLQKEVLEAINKEEEAIATLAPKMQELRSSLFESSPMTRSQAEALAQKIRINDSASKIHDSSFIRGKMADFHLMTNGAVKDSLQLVVCEGGRAFASEERKLISTGGKTDPDNLARALWHEAAHHIEFADPAVGSAMANWIKNRAGSTIEKLSKITGNPTFGDDEVAHVGNFINPYVGKVYNRSSSQKSVTEALSMGLENFSSAQKMAALASQDFEYFQLMVGVVRRLQSAQT